MKKILIQFEERRLISKRKEEPKSKEKGREKKVFPQPLGGGNRHEKGALTWARKKRQPQDKLAKEKNSNLNFEEGREEIQKKEIFLKNDKETLTITPMRRSEKKLSLHLREGTQKLPNFASVTSRRCIETPAILQRGGKHLRKKKKKEILHAAPPAEGEREEVPGRNSHSLPNKGQDRLYR